jgi:hypothetical protein
MHLEQRSKTRHTPKKTNWKNKFQDLTNKVPTVGTPMVLYTKPDQNQNTEMMLVVMTDACVILGVLNT